MSPHLRAAGTATAVLGAALLALVAFFAAVVMWAWAVSAYPGVACPLTVAAAVLAPLVHLWWGLYRDALTTEVRR